MKYRFILFFIVIAISAFSCTTVNAQFKNKRYQTESIYIKGSKYVKSGIEYPLGFWAKNLKQEMEVSPSAMIKLSRMKEKGTGRLSSLQLASLRSFPPF